jgi:hypothetical protein
LRGREREREQEQHVHYIYAIFAVRILGGPKLALAWVNDALKLSGGSCALKKPADVL